MRKNSGLNDSCRQFQCYSTNLESHKGSAEQHQSTYLTYLHTHQLVMWSLNPSGFLSIQWLGLRKGSCAESMELLSFCHKMDDMHRFTSYQRLN